LGKIKDDLKLIDYLKEKGISHEEIKTMIEDSIDTALEEKEEKKEDPEVEPKEPEELEEVPTFSKDDIKEMIQEEVIKSLKIKRKVPSKGKTIKPEEVSTDTNTIKKNWFEVMV